MRYFVLTDDGHKYGPADVQTLNQWIAENRIVPMQMVEEEGTGARVAAQRVPGIYFPSLSQSGPPMAPPPGPAYSGYYRTPQGHYLGDDGSRDIAPALVLFVISLVMCCAAPFLSIAFAALGVHFANKARKKGHRQGATIYNLNFAILVLAILMTVAGIGASIFGGFW